VFEKGEVLKSRGARGRVIGIIKMDMEGIAYECVDWILLALERNR
jgi:hypothetical protein